MPRTRRSYVPEDEEDMNELSFYEGPPWEPPDVICDQLNESGILANNQPLQKWAVENVVKLLDDECTVPFIARYRKEQTNNMEAPVIREIKSTLEELKAVQEKTKSHLDKLAKEKKLTLELRESFCNSHSMIELEQLFAPFKSGSKTTLAERARKAGLEPAAELLLGKDAATFNAQNYLSPDTKGCGTAGEVEKGVQHIIADTVAKDKTTMDQLRAIYKNLKHQVYLNVTKTNQTRKKTKKEQVADPDKFQIYFDRRLYITNIKPHQVLAINRGEDLKVLSVKVVLPDALSNQFFAWGRVKWALHTPLNSYTDRIIKMSVEDAYNRLMSPMLIREIRSTLNKSADKASVDVFGQNLHRLLLTPPVKGRNILGVDPGYKNGCKLALISPTGDVLHTDVSYIHTGNRYREKEKIIQIIKDFGCSTVGIGNGTACRQTEEFFTQLIGSGALAPLPVMYCIVNEDGASIYSVSPEADKEMPNLDPNLRSAVSIARRLQDPLAELVKIEPKHIGVGMYQHDIPERRLKLALDDVVEECVSFVGVDLNICSEVLLRCVSGISASQAKKIIGHRKTIGTFSNREQLLEIKGVGPKTFKQCAGFVRINPSKAAAEAEPATDEVIVISDSESTEEDVKPFGTRKRGASRATTSRAKRKKTSKSTPIHRPEPLDATWIHPESYDKTRELLKMAVIGVTEIGTPDMRCKLDKIVHSQGKGSLARCIDVGEPTLQLIIDGLKQPVNYDIRVEFEKPLFKQGVLSVDHVVPGMKLTGRVMNAVHFGVFVDIGVGTSGLCHSKNMPWSVLRGRNLGPGDKIEVVVLDKKPRNNGKTDIGLRLVAVH